MSEAKHKVISLDYQLHRDTAEGEMVETTEGKDPLVFMTDVGQMIPEFEENVKNLSVGDKFSFGIKAENAYGTKRDDAIIELPHDIFMQDGKLMEEVAKGNTIPLQDQQGQIIPAVVVSLNEKTVTMDVNHPLADQDLHFSGSIVEVREATAEEISHGHVHGPGGEEH